MVIDGVPETTYYVYDAAGQRVRKVTERQAADGTTARRAHERVYVGDFETYRTYDGTGQVVALERQTLHVMDAERRVASCDSRLQGDDPSPARLIRYQIVNHVRSVGLELDESGALISYEEYFPYGSTSYQALDATIRATAKRYRYTGMERDEETGLSYHARRYLICWLGRWSSCDPAGLIDGVNPFRYVRNRPTTALDSTGLFSWSDLGSGGVTAAELQALDDTPTTTATLLEPQRPQVRYPPEVQARLNALQRQQQRFLRQEALEARPTRLEAIQETADRVSLVTGVIPTPATQAISVGADLVSLGTEAARGHYKTAAFGLSLSLLPGPAPRAGLDAADDAARIFASDVMPIVRTLEGAPVDVRRARGALSHQVGGVTDLPYAAHRSLLEGRYHLRSELEIIQNRGMYDDRFFFDMLIDESGRLRTDLLPDDVRALLRGISQRNPHFNAATLEAHVSGELKVPGSMPGGVGGAGAVQRPPAESSFDWDDL